MKTLNILKKIKKKKMMKKRKLTKIHIKIKSSYGKPDKPESKKKNPHQNKKEKIHTQKI